MDQGILCEKIDRVREMILEIASSTSDNSDSGNASNVHKALSSKPCQSDELYGNSSVSQTLIKPQNPLDTNGNSMGNFFTEEEIVALDKQTDQKTFNHKNPHAFSWISFEYLSDNHFTPFLRLSKFPYKYISNKLSEQIATRYFTVGKFFTRNWDVYYVWPDCQADRPLLYVKASQFKSFLQEMALKYPKIEETLHQSTVKSDLLIKFPDHPLLTPQYLGKSKDRTQIISLSMNATRVNVGDFCGISSLDENYEMFQVYLNCINKTKALNKNESKVKKFIASNYKAPGKKTPHTTSGLNQLINAERYLGMLPSFGNSNAANEEVARLYTRFPRVNLSLPPPYVCDRQPIFVCIDSEWFERQSSILLEIGVSTLDTLDLVSEAPGTSAESWIKKIRYRHFRINEYKSLVNSKFVAGCPDQFKFGKSKMISRDNVKQKLESCFRPPYSADIDHTNLSTSELLEPRSIVLIGHGISNDIKELKKAGFNLSFLGDRLIGILDTEQMWKSFWGRSGKSSLGACCSALNIEAWGLHNAGNDAGYTMMIFLKMVLKNPAERGEI